MIKIPAGSRCMALQMVRAITAPLAADVNTTGCVSYFLDAVGEQQYQIALARGSE